MKDVKAMPQARFQTTFEYSWRVLTFP